MFNDSNEGGATWEGVADTAFTGVAPAGRTSEQRILELLAAIPVRVAA